MNSLIFLWELSLVLCAIGAIALLVLILARFVAAHSAHSRDEVRRELLPLLLGGGIAVGPLRGIELEVAAGLTCELAELTRGSDRSAMLERATAMGVPALLERRLHARSAQVRLTAVETLGLFEQEGEATRSALDDRNPDVRLCAALALAQRGDAPPPSELVAKLKVGTEERSLLLVSMMADLAEHDPGAVAGLLFESGIPYDAKVAAIEALSESGSQYAPLLAVMAREAAGEPDLQPRLFRALGRTEHPAGLEAILAGLASPDWPVRASAAQAAGKAGLGDAADPLGALLADENWWVRYRAGEALLRLGPRGIAALHRAGASDDPLVRETAAAIMAEGRAA